MTKLLALAVACCAIACGNKQDEAAPSGTAGSGSLDACALMPRDKVEAAVGELQGPSHSIAQQLPVFGICRLRLAGDLQVTLTVRALTDFDAMADGGTELAGLGDKALMTQRGLMMLAAGRPHFFQIVISGPNGLEEAKMIELAKVVAAAAK